MSKKKEPTQLTPAQLYELKWFCKNVTGLRPDFYKVLDSVTQFDDRMKRLEKTCAVLEKFFDIAGDSSDFETVISKDGDSNEN